MSNVRRQGGGSEPSPPHTRTRKSEGRGIRRGSGRGTPEDGGRGRRRDASAPAEVFASQFYSMHGKCRAARYKVHMPGCDCQKIASIRLLLRRNDVSRGAVATRDTQMDGLVILPDVRKITALYLCKDTGREDYSKSPQKAEIKLKREIFHSSESGHIVPPVDFKMSCAICLLRREPNGFVCVSSPSVGTVEMACDLARRQVAMKKSDGTVLHADHADHTCVLPRRLLGALDTAKTRCLQRQVCEEMTALMRKQGVPVAASGDADSDCGNPDLELGNHLKSLLRITQQDTDSNLVHWMVMVHDATKCKRKNCFRLDLPGGKRHLGESSFDGARRETEEETSLQINEAWVVGDPRRARGKSNEGNVYYMIRPPAELMLKEMESNSFWQQPGFCKEPSPE